MMKSNKQIVLTCEVPENGTPGSTFHCQHFGRFFEVLVPEKAVPGQTICLVVPEKSNPKQSELQQLKVPFAEGKEITALEYLMGVAREIDEKLAISATATKTMDAGSEKVKEAYNRAMEGPRKFGEKAVEKTKEIDEKFGISETATKTYDAGRGVVKDVYARVAGESDSEEEKPAKEFQKKADEAVDASANAAEDTFERAKELPGKLRAKAKEVGEDMDERYKITETMKEAEDAAKDTLERAKEFPGKMQEKAKKLGKDIDEQYKITDTMNDVQDAAKDTWEQTKEKAGEWKDDVEDEFEKNEDGSDKYEGFIGTSRKWGEKAVDKVKELDEKFGISEKAVKTYDAGRGVVKDVYARVAGSGSDSEEEKPAKEIQKAQEAVDAGADAAKETWERTKELPEKLQKQAKKVGEDIDERYHVTENMHEAEDAAKETWERTKELPEKMQQKAKKLGKDIDERYHITENMNEAEDAAKDTWERAKELPEKMQQKAKKVGKDFDENMHDAEDDAEETWEQAKDKAGEWKDQAEDKAGELKEQAKDKANEMKEQAKEAGEEFNDEVVEGMDDANDAGQDIYEGVVEASRKWGEKAGELISAGANAISSKFKGSEEPVEQDENMSAASNRMQASN